MRGLPIDRVTHLRRPDGVEHWDPKIIDAYLDRTTSRLPLSACETTLQASYVRQLVVVVADLAVRSSVQMGISLAALESSVMRDAALSVALDRYLAVLPRPSRPADGHFSDRISERILSGLVFRRDPDRHGTLTKLSVSLPSSVRDQLDREVDRVLTEVDSTDLEHWGRDFAADIGSSIIEAIAAEWMHRRSLAFQTLVGRDQSLNATPSRRRNRPRSHHLG